MTARLCIKIHERDNVAVAIRDLPKGTEVLPGVVTVEDIPQAHKIALADLPKGTEVYRYGVCLGTVDRDLPKGSWINEKNLVIAPFSAPVLIMGEKGTGADYLAEAIHNESLLKNNAFVPAAVCGVRGGGSAAAGNPGQTGTAGGIRVFRQDGPGV